MPRILKIYRSKDGRTLNLKEFITYFTFTLHFATNVVYIDRYKIIILLIELAYIVHGNEQTICFSFN